MKFETTNKMDNMGIKEALWRLKVSKFSYYEHYGMLQQTFIREEWRWLIKDLKKHTIAIDVGAYIGDTAVYLAREENIEKIYAYEPFPNLYKEARANVDSSLFGKKIELINKGVGKSAKTIHTPKNYEGTISSSTSELESGSGQKIEIESVANVLKGKKNVIIKADAEGAEGDVIEYGNLGNVYRIQLEYHDNLDRITKALKEKGFKFRVEPNNDVKLKDVGYVCAWR